MTIYHGDEEFPTKRVIALPIPVRLLMHLHFNLYALVDGTNHGHYAPCATTRKGQRRRPARGRARPGPDYCASELCSREPHRVAAVLDRSLLRFPPRLAGS